MVMERFVTSKKLVGGRRSTGKPGAVMLAGVHLVGFVADGVAGEQGVEVREGGLTLAVVRDLVDGRLLLRGCNQLFNGEFRHETENWRLDVVAGSDKCLLGTNLKEEWHLAGGYTAYIHQKGKDASSVVELSYVDPVAGTSLPVVEGRKYHFSGYFATHRCGAELALEWLDAREEPVELSTAEIPDGIKGGTSPEDFRRIVLSARAPSGVYAVRPLIRKHATRRKDDSYVFFHKVHFAEVEAGEAPDDWAVPRWTAETLALLRTVRGGAPQAFNFALPDAVLDQRKHVLEVVSEASGAALEGSPVVVHHKQEYRGEVTHLEGASVVGWAENVAYPDEAVKLILSVNGEDVARGVAKLSHKSGTGRNCGFRLPLPCETMNGLPSVFDVRVALTNERIGQIAATAPSTLTPWQRVQRSSNVTELCYLAPPAAYRYRALAAHLEHQARSPAEAVPSGQLSTVHEVVAQGFEGRRVFPKFNLPQPNEPLVTVIIPVHNSFEVTYNCLAALVLAHNCASYEVVVVDDGSDDETTSLEEIVDGTKVVRNETAGGFIRACKRGAEVARGAYLVFLNNDTEPVTGWLDELVFVFENFEDVGISGSQLLYPDGRLQDAGGVVWGNGDPWNYGRGKNPHDPRFGYTRQADYVSGASLMIPRQLWDEVGGFDEAYCPAYFEDTDLAYKVRERGKKVVYTPLSKVYHFEGMSHGTDTSSGLKHYQEVNRPKFKRNWASAFHGGGSPGIDDVDLVKDRGIRGRALFIDH